MGIKDSVKKGFSVAKNSMGLVLVLFVFGTIWNLISLALSPKVATDTPPDLQTAAPLMAAGLVFILLSIFLQAGSLGYVRDKIKSGQASLSVFVESGKKYYLSLLLLGLAILAVVGGLIVLAAVAMALLATVANVVGIIIALLLAALAIYFALLIFLAPYIIVCDNKKVIESIKASMAMVKKNILKVLGILVILLVIGFGAGLILGVIFALLTAASPGMVTQVIFAVLSSFVNAYLGLVVTGAFMGFYLANSSNTAS